MMTFFKSLNDWATKNVKVEIERDKKYETNWVWYHTILAIELLICNFLLLWIAIILTIEILK